MVDVDEIIRVWHEYLGEHKVWQEFIKGLEPITSECGLIYELGCPLKRQGEDFGVADMRQLDVAEPHYHPTDNWEFYFVLQGNALVVVGKEERHVGQGDVVAIPPNKAHYTVPDKDFVIALVDSPPFRPEAYITFDPKVSHDEIDFDAAQFKRLTTNAT